MKKLYFAAISISVMLFSCIELPPIKFGVKNLTSIDSTLSFRGIFAVDKNMVYVCGTKGSLYFTENGGKNWQKINVPDSDTLDFRDVEITKPGTILLMSAGVGGNSKIFKSTDNGKTWKLVYINHYLEGFLDTIKFWNNEEGIAIGDPVNGKFYILLTNNGGDSWYEADTSKIPFANKGEAQFAASGTCISVFGEHSAWIGTGGIKARILKTTDTGKSWNIFDSPLLQGKNSTGIFSICFSNANNGIIVGGNYLNETGRDSTAAYTTNGGKSWSLVDNGELPYQSSVKNYFDDTWFSTGPAGTYLSYDKKDWEIISGTGFHCMSISKKDRSVWLAGSKGRVGKIILEK